MVHSFNLLGKILACGFLIFQFLFLPLSFAADGQVAHAVFAGGCFWCVESTFEKIEGVKEVVSGYMGGTTKNPTYQNYAEGDHVEVVEITFDPSIIRFEQLLDALWREINPTDSGGQFNDRGPQYRPAIFYLDETQKQIAEDSIQSLETSGRYDDPIQTELIQASTFYPAEEYHQDYYKKNPIRYKYFRFASGRDRYLKRIWGAKA